MGAAASRRAALERLARLLDGDVCLPRLDPGIATIHEFLDRDDFHMQEVADTVGRDPTVAAGVVRVANTAHYSRGRAVGSLRDACVRIGPRQVVAIALEVGVAEQFATTADPYARILRGMWRNAIVTSRIAVELARALGRDNPDRLRVAALFHNIGELVVVQLLSEMVGTHAPSEDVIATLVDVNHERLGRKLTEKWMLRHNIRKLAGSHHQPRPGSESREDKALRQLVVAAWSTALSVGYAYLPGHHAVGVQQSLATLGLGPQFAAELTALVEAWEV